MNTGFDIGKRIHTLRTEQGLSQEQLALRAEITPTYLGLIERNLKNPTVKVIEQLCNALHISLVDFFQTSQKPTFYPDSLSAKIMSQFDERSAEEKQHLLQILKDVLKFYDSSNK